MSTVAVVNWHGRDIPVEKLGWFSDRVCLCSIFKYRKEDLTWPDLPDWSNPPRCRTCGLLDRQLIQKCFRCDQLFYCYFSHPRMGFYHDKAHNPVGWLCYDCCENDMPGGVSIVPVNIHRQRIPPIGSIVPPDYRHAVKAVLPDDVQARLDSFKEMLKGL